MGRERDGSHLLVHFLNAPQHVWMEPGPAGRSWELNLNFPHEQQEPNHMSHHCCLPKAATASSWSREAMYPTQARGEGTWSQVHYSQTKCSSPELPPLKSYPQVPISCIIIQGRFSYMQQWLPTMVAPGQHV